jgi:hypothetical protein
MEDVLHTDSINARLAFRHAVRMARIVDERPWDLVQSRRRRDRRAQSGPLPYARDRVDEK